MLVCWIEGPGLDRGKRHYILFLRRKLETRTPAEPNPIYKGYRNHTVFV